MSRTGHENDEQRARLTRALIALKDLRSQLDELRRAQAEPIAIVGLGCRFPGGADDPDGFWRLLRNHEDAIREVPPERWDVDAYYAADPEAAGKICTRHGGFLDRVDQFDPHFFGIAPREAASLDPQQRLLLEVAWEALEHAGLAPDRLRGSRTGVFVGISSNEYVHLLVSGGPERIDSYMGSGNAHSIAAGRLSYVFGFEGPSLAVDTACSSSLVTAHLACQSLRLGECDLAFAGGVNVLLTPTISINHSRARMLAPDGRCKTFDAAADGFVRSEGCGLVVLKRLSAALADGDPILAVIRGSAVNQDGRTSGLTVPNGPSQQAVIRQALVRAGLSPAEVSYVEAHGTGTALGDPIELHALAAVFGGERPAERPLVVGSVKTNIGHAEAAAGIAGLIKVVLALRHETIPANLHFHRPNPRVAWDESPVTVPSAALPWPKGPEPRVAGVSSFGFGGTNAHLVVADPPAPLSRPAAPKRPLHLLALSAQSDEALKTLAARYARYLAEHPEHALGDVCHTANAGRAHFRHRLGVTASSAPELHTRLEAFAAEGETAGLVQSKVDPARPPSVGFLFTGQGAQYAGMGRELYETQPGFRRDLDLCDGLLKGHLERPLLEVLYAADGALDETAYTQPALFALEYCLGRLWMSWGVVPDVLMGHSLGEYVAACLAGVFSLEDGIRLIAARARLMQQLPDDGAMAAVFASEAEVRAALGVLASDLEVAAINGPEHVVVSGRRASLDRVVEHFARQGVETRALKVSQAFHSVLVEPMLAELERVAVGVSFSPPHLDIVSNVTGGLAGAELAEPGYWRRHARQPVRFCEGMRTLEEHGVGIFLEVGPHPVLLGMGRRCVSRPALMWLPSLRRGQGDWHAMLDTLAALYVRGVPVDWRGFDAGYGRRRVRLPTYPFQRQRYWAAPPASSGCASLRPPASRDPRLHPLLGARWRHARRADDILFEGELSAGQPAFLDDHRVFGMPIMPASGYMEMALAAGAAALAPERMSLENLSFHRPLTFRDGETRIVQTSLQQNRVGGYALHIHSRSAAGTGEPAWALHASGTLRVEAGPEAAPRESLAALRGPMVEAEPAALYEAYACHGVAFGPAFRAVRELWRGQGEALARIVVPKDAEHGETYWLHPVWLDACAQAAGAAAPETGGTCLQTRIERVRVYRRPAGPAWCHAWVRPGMDGAVRIADVRLLDDAGEVLVEVSGLEARPPDAASLRPEGLALYQLRWLPQPRAPVSADCLPAPGTTAGWWRFTDYDVRPSYPLLDAGKWREFLMANGFASAESAAAHPERYELLARQALVVARKAGSEPAQAADGKQTWLILADAGGFGEELAGLLAARGRRAVRAYRCAGFAQRGEGAFALDPVGQEDFRRVLAELSGAGEAPLHAILHLWGLDSAAADGWTAADLMADSVALSGSVLRLAQALATPGLERPPALWLVTRGALAVGDMSRPPALKQAALWGTGKVIAREYPGCWGGMLDLDPAEPVGEGARLLDEVCFPDGEDHLAFRGGERYAARIVPCGPVPEHAVPVRGDGAYLITGGLGALGLETARWLVEQGARRLALVGRSGAVTDAARRTVAELERRGAKVDVFRADVADEAAMEHVFAALRAAGLSLRGVVHAAGIPGRGAIAELEPADLDRMFAAKVAGTWVLHQLAREWNLDFFVCFSSMVSLWGAREQCHYVAANHVLDLFVHYRRALGFPALAVNWGPLEGGGMLPPQDVAILKRIGVATTPMSRAVRVLGDLLGSEVTQAGPVDIDWPLFRSLYQARGRCRLFDLVAGGAAAPRPEPPAEAGIRECLSSVPESERREILAAHVQAVLGRVLGLEAGRLPERQQGFFDMGMDSLTAVELRTELQASLAVSLPATLAFDYGTVDTLADYLLRDPLDLASSEPAADAREAGGQGEASREMIERRQMIERMSDNEVEILLEAKLLSL